MEGTSASSQVTKKIKRRRAYESTGLNIEPHRKRPKIQTSYLLSKTDKRRKKHENKETGKTKNWKKDVMWMIEYTTNKNMVPPWIAWNSIVTPTPEHIHQVWYLPQISQSPTQHSVIAETMNRSLIVAMEAGKTSIAVTYDLAIPKVAMQI